MKSKFVSVLVKNLPGEIWKDVVDWDGRYKVSNFGRVKTINPSTSLRRNVRYEEVLRKPRLNSGGYHLIILSKPGRRLMTFVHRLLMIAFVSNPENKPCVNHIDGNSSNNDLNNLEWVTKKENTRHAWRIGLCTPNLGSNHGATKLDEVSS